MTDTENNQPIEFNSALELNADFQRACGEFVYKHIERKAGELIDMLLHIPDHEYMAHSEAAMDIAYRPLTADDYSEQCSDSKITVNPLRGGFCGFYILGGENAEYHEDIELFDNEVEAWESAYSYIGQDEPDRQEAFEFWAVSDDLAHWLYLYHEAVNRDILGFAIWGRTTSGQDISMDSVIQRIFWDRLNDSERDSFIQKIGTKTMNNNIILSAYFVTKIKNGFNDLHHSDDTLTRIITHDGETYYYELPTISESEFRLSILASFETEPSHVEKYGDTSWKAIL